MQTASFYAWTFLSCAMNIGKYLHYNEYYFFLERHSDFCLSTNFLLKLK